jgi:hypothetical protein
MLFMTSAISYAWYTFDERPIRLAQISFLLSKASSDTCILARVASFLAETIGQSLLNIYCICGRKACFAGVEVMTSQKI